MGLAVACGAEGEAPAAPVDTETVEPDTEAAEPEEPAYSEACGDAVADAADVDEMQDTVEDLDPAIAACTGLAEFSAATDDHPDALDGADAETFATNRCLYSEDSAVQNSAICGEFDS